MYKHSFDWILDRRLISPQTNMDEHYLPWIETGKLSWNGSGKSYIATIDLSAYSLETVMKTCYLFLDQCFLFVSPAAENKVCVYFTPLDAADDLAPVIGEFSNRLIWQETRRKITLETSEIRNMIVAQAFAEADITVDDLTESDYNLDPARIAD